MADEIIVDQPAVVDGGADTHKTEPKVLTEAEKEAAKWKAIADRKEKQLADVLKALDETKPVETKPVEDTRLEALYFKNQHPELSMDDVAMVMNIAKANGTDLEAALQSPVIAGYLAHVKQQKDNEAATLNGRGSTQVAGQESLATSLSKLDPKQKRAKILELLRNSKK